MARIGFFYEFASTYSYLSAMRIERLARERDVEVRWRPFLLGPIFKARGWDTSPFNIYPDKGRYMVRDMERLADAQGLVPFRLPKTFPANSVLAARAALALGDEARPAFSRAVYHAEFAEEQDIADRGVIGGILQSLRHDAERVLAATGDQFVKDKLRAETDEALRLGIFGAPAFVTVGGELFWGNDRLEMALDWASAN